MSDSKVISALEYVARQWIDVDYPPRVEAIQATLGVENHFTVEALHFAINQQMNELTAPNLQAWLSDRSVTTDLTVGVLNPGNVPMADLQDLIAAVLLGVTYRGSMSSRSPYLLSAFVSDLQNALPECRIGFVSRESLMVGVDKLIATGTAATLDAMKRGIAEVGISSENVLLRGPGFGVAILDGSESSDDFERLAEDILMHDGAGCRSIAIIWAPTGYEPDPLLEAMARFRSIFPAAAHVSGRNEMQRAYLDAIGFPHAYSEDKSFLVSRGAPEVQQPGHVRWSEYGSDNEIWDWVRLRGRQIQVIVSRDADHGNDSRTDSFGNAQRPSLGWRQSGRDVIDFLVS